MDQVELDSFVSKLKSLWQLGFSATLHLEVEGGKASAVMKADLGFLPPPTHYHRRHGSNRNRGPAYNRRQAQRRKDFNDHASNTIERHFDAVKANSQNVTPVTEDDGEVTEQVAHHDNAEITEAEDNDNVATTSLEQELRAKIRSLQDEIQEKNEALAVNNMLHEDFKEMVKNKYFYSSDDEISDYEPDEAKRELSRQDFLRRKLEKRSTVVQKNMACLKCNFIAKSEPGLKTHVKKKH